MPLRFDSLAPGDFGLPAAIAERVMSPALVIRLDRVRQNLARVLAHLQGQPERWRAHVKTVKIPQIFDEVARAGVRNFKCATTREANELAAALERNTIEGDVLVAYPALGPTLARLAEIAREHRQTRFSVLAEDPSGIDAIPEPLGIFADVNSGMNRTGIPAGDPATLVELARRAGARFRGVHWYEGHVGGTDAGARRAAAFASYDLLIERIERLVEERLDVPEVVTSGTPSFLHALEHAGLAALPGTRHRVSPGTVVFHDLRSEEEVPELGLVPAAVVFSRVISHPRAGFVTCDAGSKSIAADAGDPCAYVLGHPDLRAHRPSEEHLPLEVVAGPRPPRGTTLLLVPRHVCPTVNLAEAALLVDGDRLVGIVPVSARAHELWLSAERPR